MITRFLLLLNILCISTYGIDKNLLVVVIMVKNEEPVIVQTLEPFVNGGISSFIIFDTGSTDKTIETAKLFLENYDHINAHIFEEPFIDFATSRNHALDVAEKTFPQAQFFVMPDAEWYLHNTQGLIEFCKDHAQDTITNYLIRIVNKEIDFCTCRLIRAHTNARFAGVCHEIISGGSTRKLPSDVYFQLGSSRLGKKKSSKRWQQDLLALSKKHESNPQDPRTLFYLAQTYECLEDYENAYKYYKIRSEIEGWHEENYENWYRLARVTMVLAESNPQYSWHQAFDYYSNAHKISPHRAEPLVAIAQHYWPNADAPENIPLCYLFAKQACALPYPQQDLLFIEPKIYTFTRYELLSKSAWYMNDFESGERATRKALLYQELPHLVHNLNCYLEAKNLAPKLFKNQDDRKQR